MKDFQTQQDTATSIHQEKGPSQQENTSNQTGIPDNLKASMEYMSQVSLDDVRVHYNSSKPAELAAAGKIKKNGQVVTEAFAYTEGINIYIAPGQEKYLAHELWHVVQQKLEHLKADQEVEGTPINTQINKEKEADEQGDLAQKTTVAEETSIPELATLPIKNAVAQGVFNFQVDPDTEEIQYIDYRRDKENKFLTGNKQHKHTTADAVRDNMFSRIAQGSITEFGKGVILLADSYLAMPGVSLIEKHQHSPQKTEEEDSTTNLGKRKKEESPSDSSSVSKFRTGSDGSSVKQGSDGIIQENYILYDNAFNELHLHKKGLTTTLNKYESDKQSLPMMELIYKVKKTITALENFMDLMPLTNVVDPKTQKGSAEGTLKEKILAEDSGSGELWGFFDTAAITLVENAEDKTGLTKVLPWINPSSYKEEDSLDTIKKDIIQKMIANHINIMNLAYPEVVNRSLAAVDKKEQFGTKENINQQLGDSFDYTQQGTVTVSKETAAFKTATVDKDSSTTLPLIENEGSQGPLSFNVNPSTSQIEDPLYRRSTKNLFLIGNKQGKHVTADSIRANMWTSIATGKTLSEFAKGAIGIAEVYQNLPGLSLLDYHIDADKSESDSTVKGDKVLKDAKVEEAIKDTKEDKVMEGAEAKLQPLEAYYIDFKALIDGGLDSSIAATNEALKQLKKEKTPENQFKLMTDLQDLAAELERFMDLMPLVNLESTMQKGGYESQAKQYLEDGTVAAGIDSTNKALWAFFDRDAISELQESNEDDEETNNSSLTWMDHLDYMEDYSDDFDPIIGKMIGNHIEIATLAYTDKVKQTKLDGDKAEQFGTQANIVKYLLKPQFILGAEKDRKKKGTPDPIVVDIATVMKYIKAEEE